MKPDIKKQDFWEYVARIQEEVGQEVLEQVTLEEYLQCMMTFTDYMSNLRNMHLDKIWNMNVSENQYIVLINRALAKKNIVITSDYVHISFY